MEGAHCATWQTSRMTPLPRAEPLPASPHSKSDPKIAKSHVPRSSTDAHPVRSSGAVFAGTHLYVTCRNFIRLALGGAPRSGWPTSPTISATLPDFEIGSSADGHARRTGWAEPPDGEALSSSHTWICSRIDAPRSRSVRFRSPNG